MDVSRELVPMSESVAGSTTNNALQEIANKNWLLDDLDQNRTTQLYNTTSVHDPRCALSFIMRFEGVANNIFILSPL